MTLREERTAYIKNDTTKKQRSGNRRPLPYAVAIRESAMTAVHARASRFHHPNCREIANQAEKLLRDSTLCISLRRRRWLGLRKNRAQTGSRHWCRSSRNVQ